MSTPTESAAPSTPPPPRKNFEESLSEAIIAGDLDAVKKLHISRIDINRRLLPLKDLQYKPKYNPSERYINLRGPTATILSILCEQDEILEYLLENKCPDLSISVGGHTALHIAALVKDWHPMQLLIRYQYIQENINAPIDTKGVPAHKGDFTTALHTAVANRRYHQIFLLLTPFPPYKPLPAPKPVRPAAPSASGSAAPAPASEAAPEEPEAVVTYEVAAVDQRSSAGSTPLFIATFIKDATAVEILLMAGADTTIENYKGVAPLTLAKENQAKEEALLKGRPGPVKSAKIVELLQPGSAVTDLETLKQKYARELIPDVVIGDGGEEEDAGEAPPQGGEAGAAAATGGGKKKKDKGVEKVLHEILDAVNELKRRVTHIEAGVSRNAQPARTGPDVVVVGGALCANCGTAPAADCGTCHRAFCGSCATKGNVHGCAE